MQYYRGLLQQTRRIEAFRRAIQYSVGPDDRVLDLGTGLGTYAFFAADAGAARVWAVDGNPVVHIAGTVAKLNGIQQRIEFIRGWIPDVELPERATVLLFEDFPSRLMDSRVHRLFAELHRRYLEAGAKIIPWRASLYLAPVTEHDMVTYIGERDDVAYGIEWSCSREYSINTPHRARIRSESLAAPQAKIAEVDFAAPPETWRLGGSASWLPECDTAVTALAYWFDLELIPGENLSNAPGTEPASWGQLLLPIDPPLLVTGRSELRAGVSPEVFQDGAPGWLRWNAVAGDVARSGHEFKSAPASFHDLYARSPDAKPRLNSRGKLEAELLRLTDGRHSVSEIADRVRMLAPQLSVVAAHCLVIEALSGKLESASLARLEETGG